VHIWRGCCSFLGSRQTPKAIVCRQNPIACNGTQRGTVPPCAEPYPPRAREHLDRLPSRGVRVSVRFLPLAATLDHTLTVLCTTLAAIIGLACAATLDLTLTVALSLAFSSTIGLAFTSALDLALTSTLCLTLAATLSISITATLAPTLAPTLGTTVFTALTATLSTSVAASASATPSMAADHMSRHERSRQEW